LRYPETKGFEAILEKARSCLERDLPFVIYRKPGETHVQGVFQSNDTLHTSKDFTERGFVFAPFDSAEKVVLIQPDEIWEGTYETEQSKVPRDIFLDESDQETHIKLVKSGIKEIEKGKLQKVVLSRKTQVPITKPPIKIFKTLLDKYPNAFGYFFHHPKVGTWCGATPETLLKVKGNKLQTMSLAATLPYVEHEKPKWGTKEIEEQQMVSEYIGDKLAHAMERLEVDEAESVKAGKLWHLRSEVRGVMFPNLKVGEVIRALHPTPAVCGIPTDEAQKFIQLNENYKRTFYTGFLGELNLRSQGELSLYVNLRCMELEEDKAFIFVGGGITEASDPESEWLETQNKSKTMLGIL